jgi:UDP-N-acetylglucosamine 2-epimerase (non-hydrolysing)
MIKKALITFGTRPEAIKMAPVVHEFLKHKDKFKIKVCVTAQHREMLDQVLRFFEIQPDYDLNLMKPNQNLYDLTANIISNFKPILEEFNPDYVFVHGDTTTTMAASIAAFYSGAKLCHVEAGLRTNNKQAPFPEEINRQIASRLTDFHFAPTEQAKQNLLKENINGESIIITGNTVIDALLSGIDKIKTFESEDICLLKKIIDPTKDIILVTGHRRENFGQGFIDICLALKEISEKKQDVQVIYPVHLNPNVQKPVYDILGNTASIKLINPLPYEAFLYLMSQSKIIITDSGGVQEEAPSLGKPVLVMRETTERPEAVEAGTVLLVGTNKNKIIKETLDLLNNKDRYEKMSALHNPYGDGKASQRIVNFINSLN